ncbi:MAG: YfaZ family outer membrane protein [Gammaproteobacteria bacterium]|jgi:hypothetical protein|nr:YfaZ family outer membrane protein [Gammaproteobacteria bacterium]
MGKFRVVTALVLLCGNAGAGEFDFSFNQDALRFLYVHDFAESDLKADVGLALNSDEGTVINASLFVAGLASDGTDPLEAGLGARTGYVDGERSKQSGVPVAVGGFVKYTFPAMNRLSLRAEGWIAPDVLTLGELDRYQDFTVRLQYGVLKQADLYVGARYLNTEFANGSRALIDNGLNIGFNIRF